MRGTEATTTSGPRSSRPSGSGSAAETRTAWNLGHPICQRLKVSKLRIRAEPGFLGWPTPRRSGRRGRDRSGTHGRRRGARSSTRAPRSRRRRPGRGRARARSHAAPRSARRSPSVAAAARGSAGTRRPSNGSSTATVLYDPSVHDPLTDESWDEDRVRQAEPGVRLGSAARNVTPDRCLRREIVGPQPMRGGE
jgi:hypothetical protein